MIKLEVELTEDECVELISIISLIDLYAPDIATKAKNKIAKSLRDGIKEIEFQEFQKAVKRFTDR